MAELIFQREQWLRAPQPVVWEFFSNHGNLTLLTDPKFKFKIVANSGGKVITKGQVITYRFTFASLLLLTWVAEITDVEAPHFFEDSQRSGPFRSWRHQHLVEPSGEGTLVTDRVRYSMPLGGLGSLANALFVRRELTRIFDYRQKVLSNIFPNIKGT